MNSTANLHNNSISDILNIKVSDLRPASSSKHIQQKRKGKR